jgi:hypothetical protein
MKIATVTDDALSLTPAPLPTREGGRIHALDVRPGDVLLLGGAPCVVVGRERALDGTIDYALAGGGRFNAHPFKRVYALRRGGR